MYPYYQQPLMSPQNYYPQQRLISLPNEQPRLFQPLSPILSQKLPYYNQERPQVIYQPSYNMPFSPRVQNPQLAIKQSMDFYSPRFEPPQNIRHPSIPKNVIRAQFLAMRPASLQELPPLNVDRRLPFTHMKQGFVKNGEIVLLQPKPINKENRSPTTIGFNPYNMENADPYQRKMKLNMRILENNENRFNTEPTDRNKLSTDNSESADSTNNVTPDRSEILWELKPTNKMLKNFVKKARKVFDPNRKTKALQRIRVLAWAMAYPRLLYFDVKITCIEKKDIKGREIQEKFEQLIEV